MQSFQQLRANFQAINNAFGDNHVGLTQDLEFAGMHNNLTFRPQSGDPTTAANQIAVYNKLVTGIPELFYRPNSSQTPIQLTYPSIQTGLQTLTPPVYFPNQYSFMAGPFIVYGGIFIGVTNNQVFTLTPGTTLLYVDLSVTNVNAESPNVTKEAIPTNITGTTFTASFQAFTTGTFDIFYFAIGM